MQPIIITSDVTSWSLRPQFYLLKKYWPHMPRPIVGGYTKPGFHIDADFISIGRFADYPVTKWSDGLLNFLKFVEDEYILFLMDDYWLNAPVHHERIMLLADYLQAHEQIARLDLTYDRLNNANWSDVETLWGVNDLIIDTPDSPYHFSYQAALWRKSMLIECIRPHETPWQSEMSGDARLARLGYYVLGTKHPPLRYTIAVQGGKLALDGGYQPEGYGLPAEDAAYIIEQSWIPIQMKGNWQYA